MTMNSMNSMTVLKTLYSLLYINDPSSILRGVIKGAPLIYYLMLVNVYDCQLIQY